MMLRCSISAGSALTRSITSSDDARKASRCWSWMTCVSRKCIRKESPIQRRCFLCNQETFPLHPRERKPRLSSNGQNIVAHHLLIYLDARLLPQLKNGTRFWNRWYWPWCSSSGGRPPALNPVVKGDVLRAPNVVQPERDKSLDWSCLTKELSVDYSGNFSEYAKWDELYRRVDGGVSYSCKNLTIHINKLKVVCIKCCASTKNLGSAAAATKMNNSVRKYARGLTKKMEQIEN